MNTRLFTKPIKKTLTMLEKQTKDRYMQAKVSDLHSQQQHIEFLVQTIKDGVGPYAALSAKLMCSAIDTHVIMLGLNASLSERLYAKEEYLSLAREKNPLIGYYLTTNSHLDAYIEKSSRSSIKEMLPTIKDILKMYFVMQHFIEDDPSSYSILKNEIKDDLIYCANKARNLSLGDEKAKYIHSIQVNNLKRFKNPLHDLNSKMDIFNIPTSGPFADEVRVIAELEIEKLISRENSNRLS
jgi:hypothetical protein